MSKTRLWIVLLGLTAANWLRALWGEYVWDDLDNLLYSGVLKQWSAVWQAFVHDAMWSAGKEQAMVGTYRPLSLATFALDLNLLGHGPFWLHLTGILWHLFAVSAVYALFERFIGMKPAFWLTLLWAVHPTAAEAVAWVNGRSEVLALGFGALALYLLSPPAQIVRPEAGAQGDPVARWRPPLGRLLLGGLCLLLAMLGKETGLVFVPLAAIFAAYRAPEPGGPRPLWPRVSLRVVAVGALAVAVYLGLRGYALSGGAAAGIANSASERALWALPTVWLKCAQAALVPYEVSIHHLSAWLEIAGPQWQWIGLGSLALQIGLAVWLWRRGQPVGAFGFLWWWATLVPIALISVLGWPGLHRWLYIGMPGLFLGLYLSVGRLIPQRVLPIAVGGYALLLAVQAQLAINSWRYGGATFAAMIDEHPESSFGYIGLGAWLLEHREPEQAEAILRQAVASPNTRIEAFDFLGRSVAAQGRCEEAWRVYDGWTVENLPGSMRWALGECYEKRGDGARALYWYQGCEYGLCLAGRERLEGRFLASEDPAPDELPLGQMPASEAERSISDAAPEAAP